MVNIPIAPKKYHTFNENEAPSHKEIKNNQPTKQYQFNKNIQFQFG